MDDHRKAPKGNPLGSIDQWRPCLLLLEYVLFLEHWKIWNRSAYKAMYWPQSWSHGLRSFCKYLYLLIVDLLYNLIYALPYEQNNETHLILGSLFNFINKAWQFFRQTSSHCQTVRPGKISGSSSTDASLEKVQV